MKRLFLITAIILTYFSFGQNVVQKIDSVYKHCVLNPQDTNALYTLNSGLSRSFYNHYDTCLYYAIELTQLARKAQLINLEVRGINMQGMCVEFQEDLDSAIVLYNQAVELSLKHELQQPLIDIYNNLGIVYSFKGLYEFSLEFAFKALRIAEEIQDTNRISAQLNNIGLRYSELDNSELAIAYYLKSIEMNSTLNNRSLSTSTGINLGREYYIIKDFNKSLRYYTKALQEYKTQNAMHKMSSCYQGLSFIWFQKEDFEKAQAYNDSLFEVANKLGDEYDLMNYKIMKANLLVKNKAYAEAVALLREVRVWHELKNYTSSLKDVYLQVSSTFKANGEIDSALFYMEKYANVKDTIFEDKKDMANKQLRQYRESKMLQEIALKEESIENQKTLKNTFITIGTLLFILVLVISNRFYFSNKTRKKLAVKNAIIAEEKQRSDNLLLNILPFEVAEELKATGKSEAKNFDEVSVLFSDFKEFTVTSLQLTAKELVEELNICFEVFDAIIDKYNIEKIKTIGDAYMAASGLHKPESSNATKIVMAALEMQAFIENRKLERKKKQLPYFEMRVGIHTGPVVAGIVGVKKFQYDIWGNTVNTAARMESMGKVGMVNISVETYNTIKQSNLFIFKYRGKIEVKGIGEKEMYFVYKNHNKV